MAVPTPGQDYAGQAQCDRRAGQCGICVSLCLAVCRITGDIGQPDDVAAYGVGRAEAADRLERIRIIDGLAHGHIDIEDIACGIVLRAVAKQTAERKWVALCICCDLTILLFGEIYADMSQGSAGAVF